MIEYRIYKIYANAAYDHLHQIRELTDMWTIIKTECHMVAFDAITRIGDVMELKFQTSDAESKCKVHKGADLIQPLWAFPVYFQ